MSEGGSRRVIEVSGLTKTYGEKGRRVEALRGVSFSVEQGEIYALLGPNGSGKTTTLNILSNLCEPDSGSVSIQGRGHRERGYFEGLSFVSGTAQFLWTFSAYEILDFYRKVYGASAAQLAELLGRFAFEEKKARKWHQLSSGEQMKVRIMRALLARPTVLLLDEPTVGLDPAAAEQFRSVLCDLRESGVTILITSHVMKDIEVLADRVCFIHNGVKKAEGALSSFRKVREFAHVSFAEPLGSVPEYVAPRGGNEYQVPLERLREALALARVERVTTVEETLEDYFIALAREAGGAGGGDESRVE